MINLYHFKIKINGIYIIILKYDPLCGSILLFNLLFYKHMTHFWVISHCYNRTEPEGLLYV
jgi:hypothetical protein